MARHETLTFPSTGATQTLNCDSFQSQFANPLGKRDWMTLPIETSDVAWTDIFVFLEIILIREW